MAPGKNSSFREYRLPPIVIGMTWVSLCVSASALTIESKDFGYIPGHTYNYANGSFPVSGLDVSAGTGKKWDFTSFAGSGYMNYTKIYSVNNVSAFPTATLAIDINGKTSAAFSQTAYFREQNGDWQNLGNTVGASASAFDPFVPMGLPHSVGKTWSSSFSYAGGSQTQSGTVVSEGTVTTKLGVFPALLAKVTNGTAIQYWFETKEYGRIALAYSPNNELYLLTSGTQNLGVKFHPNAGASEGFGFSCDGNSGSISIQSRIPGRLRIYSANGALFGFADIRSAMPWRTSMASGMYVINFASSQYDLSRSLTVSR